MTAVEILAVDLEPDWSARWPLVASVPPRITVHRADPAALDQIAAHARLALLRDGERTERRGDPEVLDQLEPAERLFVEAWTAAGGPKPGRPGEGRSWDSPGFQPPDRPPS